MSNSSPEHNDMQHANTSQIHTLYHQLLDSWNRRDATAFAALFAHDGNVVGFDGSVMNGQTTIASNLSQIFADHQTAAYIGIVKEVRLLSPETAILRAVAGMVPPGKEELNPAVNTIQSLVAIWQQTAWRIALYQNTPAQFHGRPELVQQLTDELRQALLITQQYRLFCLLAVPPTRPRAESGRFWYVGV